MEKILQLINARAQSNGERFQVNQNGRPINVYVYGNVYKIMLDSEIAQPGFLQILTEHNLQSLHENGASLTEELEVQFEDGSFGPHDFVEDLAKIFEFEYLIKK